MSEERRLVIKKQTFSPELFDQLDNFHFAKANWPIIYILSDDGILEAYIGETTDTFARMKAHLASEQKARLTSVHLIGSTSFNKSATLDIEANLIKYFSGDGKYKLMNANVGLSDHNYFQKKEYSELFESLWDQLRKEGITRHSLEHINNSDLFKYSPYKSLSYDQINSLAEIIDSIVSDTHQNILIEGGAGTGKTILAVFLFKLLSSELEDFSYQEFGEYELEFIEKVRQLRGKYPKPKIALVVPMASFRKTLQKVFRNVKGLSAKMVIGPSKVADEKYDILVIDEAHRLRRRVNLGSYYGAFDKTCVKLGFDKHSCSELDWILQQSEHAIFFYDSNQSIKPSDALPEAFERLRMHENTIQLRLKSQFRVLGGVDYVNFISRLLNCGLDQKEIFYSKQYEFLLFDSLEDMVHEIKNRDKECGLSRLIAGYAWKWISKNDSTLFDIEIDDIQLKWNSTSTDWINKDGSVNEVGCIHTTQGYDLNYAGIIFGSEIGYDQASDQIIIRPENYHDRNGKQSVKDPEELKAFILNIYKTILLRGIRGTYVYACDPDLRAYLARHIPSFTSTAIEEGDLKELIPYTNCVPLYNLSAAAGGFGEEQTVDEMEWIRVPDDIKISEDHFACRVVGESMNRVIPNGSICLFRRYQGMALLSSRNILICRTPIMGHVIRLRNMRALRRSMRMAGGIRRLC